MENTEHLDNVEKNEEDLNGNDKKPNSSQLNNSKPHGKKLKNQESRKKKKKERIPNIDLMEVLSSDLSQISINPLTTTVTSVKCIIKKKSNKKKKSDQPPVNITPSQGKVSSPDAGQVQNPKKKSSSVKSTRSIGLGESSDTAATAKDKQDKHLSGKYSTGSPVIATKSIPLWPMRKIQPAKTQKLAGTMKRMHIRIQKMNAKLKAVTKKQREIERRMTSHETTTIDHGMIVSEVCRLIEPTLKRMVDKTTDEAYTETMLKQKLDTMQKTMTEIEPKHLYGMFDNDMYLKLMSHPLSQSHSLKVALQKLFETSVIPKVKQAFSSMFEEMCNVVSDKSIDCTLQEQVPIDRSKLEDYVKTFVAGGNYTEAFDIALTLLDLKLVLYVCENITIPPQQLFQLTSMKIHILLPLMQQLSFDLSSNTELKFKFLEASVNCLDLKDYSCKENVKSILSNIDKDIEIFLTQDPLNPYCCKVELLQLEIKCKINLID